MNVPPEPTIDTDPEAATIAIELQGGGQGEELLTGFKGRRQSSEFNRSKREEIASTLRNSGNQAEGLKDTKKKLSIVEIDAMFNNLTAKLSNGLNAHTDALDRLDKKSQQFDKHMNDLRIANLSEMKQTDYNLSLILRGDSKLQKDKTGVEELIQKEPG